MPDVLPTGKPGVGDLFTPPQQGPTGLRHSGKGIPMRSFDDVDATRQAIFDNVLTAASSIEPVGNTRHRLMISNVGYEGPEHFRLADQKQAVLRGETLSRRLRGDVVLADATSGTPIASRRLTLARVPYLTKHGTFVLGGTEYTLANQMRLRPGVFTRQKDNGEIESHVNVMPGKGVSHRILLEPETGVLRFQIGQAKMPLFPILKAMGASDQVLRKSLGNDLYMANAKSDEPQVVDKIFAKLIRKPLNEGEYSDEELAAQKKQTIKSFLESMELDPEVTSRTLKKPFKNVSIDQMLETANRIIRVHKGEEEPDDRDHMAFQHLMGPEDILAERFKLAGKQLRQILWKSSFKGSLDNVVPGFLTRQVEAGILSSGLGQALEEISPLDILDQQTRVSRLGYGGISSLEAIPDEARTVQPSHLSYVDSLRTPESLKIGVDSRLATMARKGPGGLIYAPYRDQRGNLVWKTPQDVADLKIALPGEMDTDLPYAIGLDKSKIRYIPREKVDLVVPEMEDTFNHLSNLIPMKSATKGQRTVMGSRMYAQALSLDKPEAPLVQSGIPWANNRSYEEEYGKRMGAVFADDPGVVTKVDADSVTVKHQDGTTREYETFNNYPLNRKSSLHSTALVQVGQQIKRGDILAKSNFTDDRGTVAVGTNLRVAYMAAKGDNYEDAYVISESAAKKLTSQHLYQQEFEFDDKVKRGRNAFLSLHPNHFSREQLLKTDEDGIAKPGQILQQGDPIVLASRERTLAHNQISRSAKASFAPDPLTWDHEAPGQVIDVAKTRKGVVVTVGSVMPMKVGDKLTGRYGDKGLVGAIWPDDRMPKDGQGRPVEVLMNELGVITRANASQAIEAVLGKIARITGKPYKIKDFKDIDDLVEFALDEARKYGLKGKEDLEDPETGRKIPGILTGERFVMKLSHTAEAKDQGRSTGGYSSDETPARGSGEGGQSKRMALMEQNALLSHGAYGFARDRSIRGQKNLDHWAAFMAGRVPPEPKVPLVHKKFFEMLKAAGINPVQRGARVQVMGMTERDIDKLAENREIQNADTVDWKEGLKPLKGGLFDPTLTGGHGGTRWSYIKLHEPLPNPVMEEPIRRVLGLTEKKFDAILSGKEELNGRKGPQAIVKALTSIDLDKELEDVRQRITSGRASQRDMAVRKLSYLKPAKELGLHPSDWVLTRVPVLPPLFRPVSVMGGTNKPLVADANYLYKELIDANNTLKDMSGRVDDVTEERMALYNAFRGVVGLGDPITPKNQERRVSGLLKEIFGPSPKYSYPQRKLLGGTVDLVGRSVITPDPNLDMDQVGLPEVKAWDVYRPFIVRRLVRRGVQPVEAARMVKDRTQLARTMLLDELEERPVVITRAPVLHRYGVMAFKPQLVPGDTMRISPMITKGFNADFDGDAMNYHVPASDAAVKDAMERMLPSKNLFSVRDFKVHQLPTNEFQAGLFKATSMVNKKSKARVFRTKKDAIRAYKEGLIQEDTQVEILEDD